MIVADEANRGEWKKGKVVRHIRGKGGVAIGLSLLDKGHRIDRPVNLLWPLKIRQAVTSDIGVSTTKPTPERTRIRRQVIGREEDMIELCYLTGTRTV